MLIRKIDKTVKMCINSNENIHTASKVLCLYCFLIVACPDSLWSMYTFIAIYVQFDRFIDLTLIFHTNPYHFWLPVGCCDSDPPVISLVFLPPLHYRHISIVFPSSSSNSFYFPSFPTIFLFFSRLFIFIIFTPNKLFRRSNRPILSQKWKQFSGAI